MKQLMGKRLVSSMALAALAIAACGGSSSGDNVNAGPCELTYLEPVLSITSATDSATAGQISVVSFTAITVNGVSLNLEIAAAYSRNVSVSGSGVVCTVPCAFSIQQGSYSFAASSPGYVSQQRVLQVGYSRLSGNCPASYSGATQLALTFARQ
jgi:hypothetical protein